MAMDSDSLFAHPDPMMLPDFCQNHFEDFEKSFFADNALDPMTDAAGFSDASFFKPLCFSESNHVSSFGKVESEEILELSSDSHKSSNVALEEPCSFNEALFDVVNYDKQHLDLKHMNTDPYILTDDLSRLVSTVKQDTSCVEMSGAAIAADALNYLSLEQLRQRQSSHGFEASGKDSLVCVAGKSYYSPLPDYSSQMCRNVSFASSPKDSSAFRVRMQHISLSLIPEYPESLSNNSLTSDVHANNSSPTSPSPRSIDTDTRLSIKTETDGRTLLHQEIQSGSNHLASLVKQISSSAATSGADQKFTSEVDSSGDCFIAIASNLPYDLHSGMIQRSGSSHSLGQLRTPDPSPRGEGVVYTGMSPSDSISMLSLGNESFIPLEAEDRANAMSGLRRVCSAGDIQDRGRRFKIGRYTIEERQSRIHRYRQKRTERNFQKKIKYACRKTLADSRPRVRGRFAKNDEGSEIHETNLHADYEEDEEGPDVPLYDKKTSIVSQHRPHILKMSSLKAEHRHATEFWNFSNAAILTSNLSLK